MSVLRSERRTNSGAIAVIAVLLMPAIYATPLSQETRADQVVVHTEYELPPATLDRAWDTAPIIVRGRVLTSAVRERPTPHAAVRIPVTEHRVEILEIFKGAPLVGNSSELTVAQDTVEHGRSPSGIAHSSGGELLQPSEEYVLFLERLSAQGTFGVAWGPGGAYRLATDTATVPGSARRMWQSRDEVTRGELLSALRSRRDKNHGKQ